jgi:hypothetical protein
MDSPGVNPQRLLSREGQAQWLRAEAQREKLQEHARYLAALQHLLSDPSFDVVLRHWFQVLFLSGDMGAETGDGLLPGTGDGEQRFFWQVLRDLRQAGAMQAQLARQGVTG